jgi:hypothetical protein
MTMFFVLNLIIVQHHIHYLNFVSIFKIMIRKMLQILIEA